MLSFSWDIWKKDVVDRYVSLIQIPLCSRMHSECGCCLVLVLHPNFLLGKNRTAFEILASEITRMHNFWKDNVVKAMFIERRLYTEFMERGYEIWKIVTAVSAAHKPQHFLYVSRWCSQEMDIVQCTLILCQVTSWMSKEREVVHWQWQFYG